MDFDHIAYARFCIARLIPEPKPLKRGKFNMVRGMTAGLVEHTVSVLRRPGNGEKQLSIDKIEKNAERRYKSERWTSKRAPPRRICPESHYTRTTLGARANRMGERH
jgi:hypothetical protein